ALQRRDVGLAATIHSLKIVPSGPINGLRSVDPLKHRVGHDAGMSTVPVREWMNVNEPMMQPDRSLGGRVGPVPSPMPCVVHQLAQLQANLDRIHADVLAVAPERAGPRPYIAEQLLVERHRESVRENIAALSDQPSQTRLDVDLFKLVQFAASRDVLVFQAAE